MKNRTLAGLFFAATMVAGAAAAQAQFRPGREVFEGPSHPMSQDTVQISRILVNRQMASCVEEFRNHNVAISDISAKAFTPTHSAYNISGIVLNGTVKTADAHMFIDALNEQYTCSVHITPVPSR